ncbi:PilC/PilY family type IV pilus protein [Neisseria leonii]|uniref:pilus assembly protein n=1 Tax=Neisseria leonii TaxID=2995413 RepID=UPI0030D16A51
MMRLLIAFGLAFAAPVAAAAQTWCPGPVLADSETRRVYIARYWPDTFGSSLTAHPIEQRRGGRYLTGPALWDAACTLTGGECAEPRRTLPPTPPPQRHWLTWFNGSRPALWPQLAAVQQQAVADPLRWAYWQGSREQERPSENGDSDGLFRARTSLLADARTGRPLLVGKPQPQPAAFNGQNRRYPQQPAAEQQSGAQSHADFVRLHAARPHTLYFPANDGLLHAFAAGPGQADDDGRERSAYLPDVSLRALHRPDQPAADFSHPQYAGRPFHDSAPQAGDVFHSGRWHTWLAGSLGSGGQAVYLLDISRPGRPAAVAEWTQQSGHPQLRHLGAHNGRAVFTRLNNGNRGILIGNGYCTADDISDGICRAASGEAGLFLIDIDSLSGTPTLHFLATGAVGGNGISGVAVLDDNRDGITDYAYAGDLQGNIWRFDLRADNLQHWLRTRPHRLFQTAAGQPVSTAPLVSYRNGRAVINFGTGLRQIGRQGQNARYAAAPQSLYGLTDLLDNRSISPDSLLVQTLSGNRISRRVLTPQNQGWRLDLPAVEKNGRTHYEQVVTDSQLLNKQWLLNTHDGADPRCGALAGGYSYAVSAQSGAGTAGFFQPDAGQPPERMPHAQSGSPVIMRHDKTVLMLADPQNPQWQTVYPDAAKRLRRLGWRLL